MMAVELAPIVKTVEVRRSPGDAFRAFAEEIGAWWPLETHTRARDSEGERSVDVTVEPRVGGRVFETLSDGRELDWGEVLAWEPGVRLELTWRLGLLREQTTRVGVEFEALEGSGCRVTLTHSDWERLGDAGGARRASYETGWRTVFEQCFAAHVERAATGRASDRTR